MNQQNQEPKPSAHFPPNVRQWLIQAWRIENPIDRIEAIEMAEVRARRNYPEYFREELE